MLIAGLLLASTAQAQRFLPDDPLQDDPDSTDAPVPSERAASDIYDFLENTFASPRDYEGPALNVNTLGEVPNSSWYTQRHYYDPMTEEQLVGGLYDTGAPVREEPWRVVDVKTEGKSAGFEIVDERGERYLVKFDHPEYMELSTGAEIVSTKFFYALGYHVPENYLVRFAADQLVPDTSEGITRADIEATLAKAPTYDDGTYRALASLFIDGEAFIGPFYYYGTRPDDANDIFRHEGRRELRGMRVFAGWLNHFDSRSINSLDVVKAAGQDTFVVHYLIDFGSTLGGGPGGPARRWTGFEYAIDWDKMFTRAVTLGFAGSGWQDIDYPDDPAVGHFDAEHFDPETWKPQYPNPAFRNMDPADAFWAAKQVMAFTDEQIRAVVASADYSDPEAEAYIAETLAGRRDKIGAAFLPYAGGLDRFAVEGGALVFEDLPARYGLVPADRVRNVIFRPFDNETGELGEALVAGERSGTRLRLPETDAPFLMAELRTYRHGYTRVYLRRAGGSYEVVGVTRVGQGEAPREQAAYSARQWQEK